MYEQNISEWIHSCKKAGLATSTIKCDKAKDIAYDMLFSLQRLHTRPRAGGKVGIPHNDVKPGNFLLRENE